MVAGGRRNADSALVTALAAGGTVEASARAAGVSETTVYRRLREPAFRQRVAEARDEMVNRAVARLSATSTLAADTLRELLKARSETVRLGAARAVLELGSRLREQEDLAERIAALERGLTERKG
jgi:DNA-binding LacI/PurR family transcriptional regulator